MAAHASRFPSGSARRPLALVVLVATGALAIGAPGPLRRYPVPRLYEGVEELERSGGCGRTRGAVAVATVDLVFGRIDVVGSCCWLTATQRELLTDEDRDAHRNLICDMG